MPPSLTCHFVQTRPKVSDSTDKSTPGTEGSPGAPAFTVVDATRTNFVASIPDVVELASEASTQPAG
jgi:hypothetical protein